MITLDKWIVLMNVWFIFETLFLFFFQLCWYLQFSGYHEKWAKTNPKLIVNNNYHEFELEEGRENIISTRWSLLNILISSYLYLHHLHHPSFHFNVTTKTHVYETLSLLLSLFLILLLLSYHRQQALDSIKLFHYLSQIVMLIKKKMMLMVMRMWWVKIIIKKQQSKVF